MLERDQRRVQESVDCQVLLAPAQPGGRVVETAQRRDSERRRVHANLQRLAVAALEDFQVHGHMTTACKSKAITAQVSLQAVQHDAVVGRQLARRKFFDVRKQRRRAARAVKDEVAAWRAAYATV